MAENKKIYMSDEFGNKKEYDVILTFHSDDFNKDYVVYTDNSYDAKNKLKIYASIYDPKTNKYIGPVENKDEWNSIYNLLGKVLEK